MRGRWVSLVSVGMCCALGLTHADANGRRHGTRLIAAMRPTAALAATRDAEPTVADPISPLDTLGAYEVITIDLPALADGGLGALAPLAGAIHLAIRIDHEDVLLELRPHSLRADEFVLEVEQSDGRLGVAQALPVRTLRGELIGRPGTRAAMTLLPSGLSGLIWLEDGRIFGVQPLAEFQPGAARGMHVVYAAAGVLHDGSHQCGVDDGAHAAQTPTTGVVGSDQPRGGGGIAGTGLKIADIAFDTDVPYYALNGSSVSATLLDIETVMNVVSAFYESEVAITYEITHVIVRTTTDPYNTTSHTAMLGLFSSQWNANLPTLHRDLAHLMTGRVLDNGIIGYANIGVVCNTSTAYGLSRSRFSNVLSERLILTAHEIGHNWSCPHCNGSLPCRIMCGSFCGCDFPCNSFGAVSQAQVISFRDSRVCLIDLAAPRTLPFFDDFSGEALDAARWSYMNGASLTGSAVNPPSDTQALLLNSAGAGAYQDDDIRTNFIRLSGASDVVVSYYTEHRFVESGEQFFAEYRSNNLAWMPLDALVSDGFDQDVFEYHAHLLPADALHDKFRLRFSVDGNAADDRWFVDNVRVAATLPLNVQSAPFDGASVSISPADALGDGAGAAPFTRRFVSGTTVTLTAAPMLSGLSFDRWSVAGVDQPVGQAAVDVMVNGPATAVARYAVPQSGLLTITSTPQNGVAITVTPPDVNSRGDGVTPFQRAYISGAQVTLTAPLRPARLAFSNWIVGGQNQPAGQNVLNYTVGTDVTLTARYMLVGDTNGDGLLNNFDIDPFVLALTDIDAYRLRYPGVDPLLVADTNGDGLLNNFDIDPFVALLIGQ